jgi:hypothetical protein
MEHQCSQFEELPPLPLSADRKKSPPKVSRKREYFKYRLETFGRFSRWLLFFRVWRHLAERKKACVLRAFCNLGAHYRTLSEWAGWRSSGIRTCLRANSLLTGNFTGKFAVLGVWETISEPETAVPQRLFEHFPYSDEQGKQFEEQGIFRKQQGIRWNS